MLDCLDYDPSVEIALEFD